MISLRKIDLSSLNKLHYLGAILYLVNHVSDQAFPCDINKCHKGTDMSNISRCIKNKYSIEIRTLKCNIFQWVRGRRSRDRMVVDLQLPVRSVPITTEVVSSSSVHDEVYSIQLYVIKFISDMRQVGGFPRVLRFPPSLKVTATI